MVYGTSKNSFNSSSLERYIRKIHETVKVRENGSTMIQNHLKNDSLGINSGYHGYQWKRGEVISEE